MRSHDATGSTPQTTGLEHAFDRFTQVSGQLIDAYLALQQQVSHLSEQLALANEQLSRRVAENTALLGRLSLLLNMLPAGVIEIDAEGRVSRQNRAASALLGEDWTHRPWEACASSFGHAAHDDGQVSYHTPQGELRHMLIQRQPLPDDDGAIILVQDVSRALEMQQQLAQQERFVAMGRMAASLAHQLRTPLATAMLYTSHLNRPSIDDTDRLKFAGKALTRLRALEGLVSDMLGFVRGHVEAREWVALPRLLADAEQVFAPQAQAREVVLDWPAQAPQVELYSDGKALLGAFVNLLENALVFSPPQGHIRVSTELGNGVLKLTVQDDGPGVSAEVAPRIFDPFFTTRADGTGLGLAIARGVAEVSGGELTLQASTRGACFRLQLPCRVMPQEPAD